MSVTIAENTGNFLIAQYDRSVVFIGDNTFESGEYTAPGAQVILADGQLMGKVAATGKLLELKSAAVDGSQIPYGVLVGDHTIEIAETPTFSICVS